MHWRAVGYWLATAAVTGELLLGGIWDIARLPLVADLVTHLGYPSYFLVLLGTWKVLGAFALLIPGRALLKEWAYAGAFFAYTGAIASHLTTGYALGEVGLLSVLTALTVLSWALRPPSRRTLRQMPASPLATASVTPRRHTKSLRSVLHWPWRSYNDSPGARSSTPAASGLVYLMIWMSQRVPGAVVMRSSPVTRTAPINSARAT